MSATALNMMEWNVKAGGFDSNDPERNSPERQQDILGVVTLEHTVGAMRAAVFSDASRWDTVYGGNLGIASHFGFQAARFTRLEDDRLTGANGEGSGIAMLTDETIAHSDALDLGNRQGMGTVLDVGRHGLQIAGVYLDDLDEDLRKQQVKAMIAGLEADVPTVLTGDFNSLRSNLNGASVITKFGDMAVRVAARAVPRRLALGQSIAGMNRREVIDDIVAAGFSDADRLCRPTAPVYLPGFGIDYAFSKATPSSGLEITDFSVHSARKASDHRYITFRVNLAA